MIHSSANRPEKHCVINSGNWVDKGEHRATETELAPPLKTVAKKINLKPRHHCRVVREARGQSLLVKRGDENCINNYFSG